MSSKKKTAATMDDAKPALVPKRRFPEFRKGEAWATEPMERLYSFMRNNSLSRDKLNYEHGSVKNIHYGDIHTKFRTLFDITQESVPYINDTEPLPPFDSEDYCVEGDLIFADASEDTNDVGKTIEIVRLNGERLLSGQHTILARRNDERLILGFGGHLFRSGLIRSQVMKEAQGTKVYGISATRLGNVEVAFPADEKEQQKIAECLSSVDELMAAQARKVDALKTHKKGLMQQLFPREGETQPRLRFPEFQNAGEWGEKRLDDLARYENGKAHENDISENGRYIVVNSKFISTEGAVRKLSNEGFCVADKGDLLMVLSDVPNGRAIAKCYFVESDDLYTVNQRICRIHPTNVYGRFLFYVLDRNSYLLNFDDGIKQTNLRKEDVVGCPLCAPAQLEEQQRIADCLTSLDDLITAETQKLEALKTHKKGLMQQLFPSLEKGDE